MEFGDGEADEAVLAALKAAASADETPAQRAMLLKRGLIEMVKGLTTEAAPLVLSFKTPPPVDLWLGCEAKPGVRRRAGSLETRLLTWSHTPSGMTRGRY